MSGKPKSGNMGSTEADFFVNASEIAMKMAMKMWKIIRQNRSKFKLFSIIGSQDLIHVFTYIFAMEKIISQNIYISTSTCTRTVYMG